MSAIHLPDRPARSPARPRCCCRQLDVRRPRCASRVLSVVGASNRISSRRWPATPRSPQSWIASGGGSGSGSDRGRGGAQDLPAGKSNLYAETRGVRRPAATVSRHWRAGCRRRCSASKGLVWHREPASQQTNHLIKSDFLNQSPICSARPIMRRRRFCRTTHTHTRARTHNWGANKHTDTPRGKLDCKMMAPSQ